MKSLLLSIITWTIALAHNYGQTGPAIGNSPMQTEYKEGKLISAKGFPPYTEIKDPYTGHLWIVQPDGSVKAESDLPRVEGTLM